MCLFSLEISNMELIYDTNTSMDNNNENDEGKSNRIIKFKYTSKHFFLKLILRLGYY